MFIVLYWYLGFSEDKGKSWLWLCSAPESPFGEGVPCQSVVAVQRFTCTCACNSLFNVCYTSPLRALSMDLLQLENGAALLKLLTFKHLAVGGLGWSLMMDAAGTFVWGMCWLNRSRRVMWLYISFDAIDNCAIGIFLLISRPGNFWIHLVFWLDTGRQEEKAVYQIPNFLRECS